MGIGELRNPRFIDGASAKWRVPRNPLTFLKAIKLRYTGSTSFCINTRRARLRKQEAALRKRCQYLDFGVVSSSQELAGLSPIIYACRWSLGRASKFLGLSRAIFFKISTQAIDSSNGSEICRQADVTSCVPMRINGDSTLIREVSGTF